MSMCGFSPVSHNLESAQHLSNGEEPDHLGGGHADKSQLFLVHVPSPSQQSFWRGKGSGSAGDKSCGLTESVEKRLEVGLESCGVSGMFVRSLPSSIITMPVLTEEPSSGLETPISIVQFQLLSNRWWAVLTLEREEALVRLICHSVQAKRFSRCKPCWGTYAAKEARSRQSSW